jgi:hypothetical protein
MLLEVVMATTRHVSDRPLPPRPAHESRWHAFFSPPHTATGWTAVIVALAACALYAIFLGLVASGVESGGTLFGNPLLGVTLLLAYTASLVAGGTALSAVVRKHDRSLPLIFTLALAIVTLMLLGGGIVGE